MKLELSILGITYIAYVALQDVHLVRRILWILFPIVVLRFEPDKTRALILALITWNILDAFAFFSKNDDMYKCTHTASISKNETTEDNVLWPSLPEKVSMSSSFPQLTVESTPPKDSMSTPQNMDAQ